MLELRPPHPWLPDLPCAIEHGSDWPAVGSREIDVFGVTQGLREMQLVERRAAAEAELFAQEGIAE
jgi:hypothetical protein